ncbi:UDP-4-amino-4,6-dideoxy-N-acetyl-beta-L-altrosamine transaminase [Hyphobacterium sp. HN65]|uniref:UDP-4-amino-4, 6-dideoxy-N-acetyl-beta-L-altrosamine transaminase n=1 Tax=Hyphobacterium lacteum TaxID=3116575 RepID=A0ABU7LQM1_9PROT|nr:UDP-4-amino-4,6-dideoxy-N-acetyl-beta-L-altrosamine transaminase [Hyphobacterium sp. HN65]MEE2526210.1 UDP-4-amino-4,6-dideoxy-N-acetyl-beta-L-altrosamine transaminase [Hyphobacterium sp. HN65]
MSQRFLPYGRQLIDEADIEAVTRVLKSDFLTTGPEIEAFERDFAKVTGAAEAVACSNGTTALHLPLAGLGVGEGDRCIVPTITFMATANAVRYCGGKVVFADVDPDTGLMTRNTLADAMARASGPVKAILPVHLGGQSCDMAAIADLARESGAVIVEDSCHAIGTERAGGKVGDGKFADAAAFSFHPVKTIAAGEGGAVTTNDPELAETMRRLRSHGITRNRQEFIGNPGEPWRQEFHDLGWNYRLPDINAALVRSQLSKLEVFAARRRELAAIYDKGFARFDDHVRPIARMPEQNPCWHLYVLRIDFEALGTSRIEVMNGLRERGVGTQVHYIPVHTQKIYDDPGAYPGAAEYYRTCLSIPLFVGMSDEDAHFVVRAIGDVLGLKAL